MRRALAVLMVGLAAGAARADAIRLKNGNTLEGKIVEQNEREVTLKTGDGQLTLPRDRIESIELGETALEVYTERVTKLGDDDAAGHFALARYCLKHGLESQAVALFRRVLAIQADHVGARAELRRLIEPPAHRLLKSATDSQARGQYVEAERPLIALLDKYPESEAAPRAHHLLAVGYAARRQYDKAFIRWSRALRLAPDFLDAAEGAANAAIALGRWADAVRYTETARKIKADGPLADYFRQRVALLEQLIKLEDSMKGKAADPAALARRGQLFFDLGLKDRALHSLAQAYQAGARSPKILNVLADHYERTGQVGRALAVCDDLAAADPTNAELVRRRARLQPLLLIPKAFGTRDPQQRTQLLARVAQSGASFAYIENALREGGERPDHKPGRVEGTFLVGERLTRASYVCYVPKGYTPRRAWPLIIALHRPGDKPTDHFFNWETVANSERYILMFPTARKDGTWRFSDIPLVLSALRHATRTYRIDTDRVCLAGTQTGGLLAWAVALRHPDRFAALVVRTAPLDEVTRLYLPAATNLPVYQLASQRADPEVLSSLRSADEFLRRLGVAPRSEEVPGPRHPALPELNPKVLLWLDAQARNPYPRRVRLISFEFSNAEAYWARVERFADTVFDPDRKIKTARPPFGAELVPEQIRDIYVAEMKRTLGSVVGAIQAGNRIYLSTKHVERLTVSLDDRLVDLDKPVRLYVNGALVFRGKVERSLGYLFESARRHGDPRLCYAARIEVNVARGTAEDPATR